MKENNIEVSVVIPMYNAEKYIAETLKSVFNQTYQNFEVIVVNDCSKDGSLKIVEEFQKNHDNLIIINNEKNMHVAESRNIGVARARGEWVAFLDADDIWLETKLEKQLNALNEANASLCYTSQILIDDNGNESGRAFIVKETTSYKKLLKQNIICMSTSIVKKELCEKYPFKNPEIHEDFIFWLEILKNENVNPVGIVEPLIKYRLTLGSKSRNKFKSVKMTYKTYKKVGLNFFAAHYNLMFYIIRSFKKYYQKREK